MSKWRRSLIESRYTLSVSRTRIGRFTLRNGSQNQPVHTPMAQEKSYVSATENTPILSVTPPPPLPGWKRKKHTVLKKTWHWFTTMPPHTSDDKTSYFPPMAWEFRRSILVLAAFWRTWTKRQTRVKRVNRIPHRIILKRKWWILMYLYPRMRKSFRAAFLYLFLFRFNLHLAASFVNSKKHYKENIRIWVAGWLSVLLNRIFSSRSGEGKENGGTQMGSEALPDTEKIPQFSLLPSTFRWKIGLLRIYHHKWYFDETKVMGTLYGMITDVIFCQTGIALAKSHHTRVQALGGSEFTTAKHCHEMNRKVNSDRIHKQIEASILNIL